MRSFYFSTHSATFLFDFSISELLHTPLQIHSFPKNNPIRNTPSKSHTDTHTHSGRVFPPAGVNRGGAASRATDRDWPCLCAPRPADTWAALRSITALLRASCAAGSGTRRGLHATGRYVPWTLWHILQGWKHVVSVCVLMLCIKSDYLVEKFGRCEPQVLWKRSPFGLLRLLRGWRGFTGKGSKLHPTSCQRAGAGWTDELRRFILPRL